MPKDWKKAGGLEAIVDDFVVKTIYSSEGANSGVSKSMLWAGRGSGDQRDIDAAITVNSKDMDAWSKNGHLKLNECNDIDLAEWCIGYAIPVWFLKRFWTSPKMNMLGICYDTELHEDKPEIPPEVRILVDQPVKGNRAKSEIIDTLIFISRDPYVQGPAKAIHRNCLREAIKDTYGPESNDWTLQQLLDASHKLSGGVDNIKQYLHDAQDEPDEDMDDDDHTTANNPGESQEDEPPPSTTPRPQNAKAKQPGKARSVKQADTTNINDRPNLDKGLGAKSTRKPSYSAMAKVTL
jgi:hypothetical protein